MENLITQVKNYYPDHIELNHQIKQVLDNLDHSEVVEITEMQIFSERQRYLFKKEVDNALLESVEVTKERKIIEEICNTNSLDYIDEYLNRLKENIKSLEELTSIFCYNYEKLKSDDGCFDDFVREYVAYADIDNAHAMYLSSDNWPFSVFQNVLELIYREYNDPILIQQILRGGIIDIRTEVYEIANSKINSELTISEHIHNVKQKDEYVNENLWSLLLLYPYANKKKTTPMLHKKEHEPLLKNNDLIEAYNKLYYARYLYDSFEYFGYYGFVRCAISHLCKIKENKKYGIIGNHILLYQFNNCLKKEEI